MYQVFATPGDLRSIIDTVNPTTGRSHIYDETLEQIQQRYPGAQIMDWEIWRNAAAAEQDTPITWKAITDREFQRALEVLPPIDWSGKGFLIGEPHDHSWGTGQARYTAYLQRGGRSFVSTRPLTRVEWRAI